MTESDWLTSLDPKEMLDFVKSDDVERKIRLFDCACCRRIWHLLPDERCRSVIEVAERYDLGSATVEELRNAVAEVWNAVHVHVRQRGSKRGTIVSRAFAVVSAVSEFRPPIEPWSAYCESPHSASHFAAQCVAGSADDGQPGATAYFLAKAGERAAQADLLRDVLGNPFRPVVLDSRWLTDTTLNLASGIYREGAFDRLPILGDALMDAECDDEQIIGHCQSDGPHVRGCWVIDVLTGRS